MTFLALLAASLMLAAVLPDRAGALPPPLGGAPPLGVPSPLGLGIVDDPLLGQSPAPVQDDWYKRAQSLGSRWVRIGVVWAAVAPYTLPRHFRASDPASRYYHWTELDRAVRAAVAHGQTPMLNVHQAPLWAQAPGAPSWAGVGAWGPSASAFGAFGHALALRYSGRFPDPLRRGHHLPRIRYLQAWNEPNLLNYLAPQWVQDAHGHIIAYSPTLYRSMLNAFYAGVKRAVRGDVVFAAGTAPFGDPPGRGAGRMEPKTFLEGLFCLNGRLHRTACPGGAAHLDGLDHHVYSPAWYSAQLPDDISTPDLGRIWEVLNAARRAHTVVPNGPKPLWITEVGASANGAAQYPLQARNLELDLYVFWREHVSNVFWFSIGDPGLAAGAFFAQGGLFTGSGAAKPAAAAYRFPFVAVPSDRTHIVLWGKAPRSGTVRVQRLYGRHWKTVARLHAGADRIFYRQIRGRGTPEFRAIIGGDVSLPFVTGDS